MPSGFCVEHIILNEWIFLWYKLIPVQIAESVERFYCCDCSAVIYKNRNQRLPGRCLAFLAQ